MNPYLAWGTLLAITWIMFAAGYLVGRLTTRIHQIDKIVAEINRQFETSRDESTVRGLQSPPAADQRRRKLYLLHSEQER